MDELYLISFYLRPLSNLVLQAFCQPILAGPSPDIGINQMHSRSRSLRPAHLISSLHLEHSQPTSKVPLVRVVIIRYKNDGLGGKLTKARLKSNSILLSRPTPFSLPLSSTDSNEERPDAWPSRRLSSALVVLFLPPSIMHAAKCLHELTLKT